MILGENGEKMSKSRGNVVNPDDIVSEYGADTLRLYEMFIGDFEKAAPWSSASIKGCKRFLERSWSLMELVNNNSGYSKQLESSIHKTIKKVSEDIENLKFNTAIAALMTLINEFYDAKALTKDDLKTFILILNPFAPHMTEEMWVLSGFAGMVTEQNFPKYDESKTVDSVVDVIVQINGKLKSKLTVSAGLSQDEILSLANMDDKISAAITEKEIIKVIYVKDKILNIVIKN